MSEAVPRCWSIGRRIRLAILLGLAALIYLLAAGSSARADLTGEPLVVVPQQEWDLDQILHVYESVEPPGSPPTVLHVCGSPPDATYDKCGIASTSLSPDGQRIALMLEYYRTDWPTSETGARRLVTMEIDGSDQRTLLEQEEEAPPADDPAVWTAEPISFTPDGLSLIAMADLIPHGTGRIGIVSIDATSGDVSLLVEAEQASYVSGPSMSADGSKLIYQSVHETGSPNQIVFATPDGETSRRIDLPEAAACCGQPRLSPDGRRLVFEGYDSGDEDNALFVLNMDTESVERLTYTPGHEAWPRWSRDSEDVMYVHYETHDTMVLKRIPADGGTPHSLVPNVGGHFDGRTPSDEYGDRRPPGLVGNFDAALDGSALEAHVRWDPAQDPREADGSRGSGVAGYLVRYRRASGSWSTSEFVGEAEIVVPGSHAGEEIEVEVSAQDAANNIGEVASDTVEVAIPSTDDFEPPRLFTSGELAERGGGYVGPEQLQLAVGAEDDEGDGVARLSLLAEDGQQLATSQPDCSGGCPVETEETFSVNTGALAEGPTTLRVRAEDQSNNRDVDEALDVYVDHTAPSAPSDMIVSTYDASSGVATVDWNDGSDPAIATGLPGSGDGAALFRYQVDGAWSSWESAHDGMAEVPGLAAEESFVVQVKSRDAVGNESPVLSASLSAEPDDGAAVEDDAEYLTQRSEVLLVDGEEEAEAAQFTNCQPLLNRVFETNHGPLYQAFVPVFTKVHTRMRLYCHTVDARFDRIRIRAVPFVKTGSGTDIEDDFKQLYSKNDPRAFDVTIPAPNRPATYRGFVGPGLDCTPGLGGDRKYLLAGTIQYIDDGIGVSPTRYWDSGRGGIGPGPKTATCPTARIRRERELAGWTYLKSRSPDGQHRSTGRQELKTELGSPPWKPAGTRWAWAAHHIVPLKESGADSMRELMFRCHIHPNEATNGLWLRNLGLRSDKPAYDELKQYDYDHGTTYHWRTYHADTRFASYVSILRYRFLRTHLKQNRETCPIENRPSVRSSVRDAAEALKIGEFGMETDR